MRAGLKTAVARAFAAVGGLRRLHGSDAGKHYLFEPGNERLPAAA